MKTLLSFPREASAVARSMGSSSAVVEPPEIERLIAGKYRVERVLGNGGSGLVVAATHVQIDQRVAIKTMLKTALQYRDALERFAREARAAARIRSDHVVHIYDVGEDDEGLPYIVMEYLEGCDLWEELEKRGALPVKEAVGIALEVCEALSQAHAVGIVHRDLKPANVFLARSSEGGAKVKVLDFGMSKFAPRFREKPLTDPRMVMGTPGWMSPEQLRSTRDVDARSDVWSLGALLYNMLAGRPPYQVETIAHACASSRPDPPSRYKAEICATLDTIVLKCLEENPRERYQTVVELARALVELRPARGREASDESSEHAGARTPPERLARGMTVVPLRRRGASLISLATAVTVILGLTRTLTPRMLVRPSLSEATLNGASEAWSSAAKALAEESTPITSRPPAVPMDRIVDAGPPVAAGNVVDHENPHPKLVQAPRTAAKERSSDASSTAAMQILAHPEFGGRW